MGIVRSNMTKNGHNRDMHIITTGLYRYYFEKCILF